MLYKLPLFPDMKYLGLFMKLVCNVILRVIIKHLSDIHIESKVINNWNEYRRAIWGACFSLKEITLVYSYLC